MSENVNSTAGEQDDSAPESAPDAAGKLIPERVADELLIMTWPM